MLLPIYLDYAATTPVDESVAEKMTACLTKSGVFGNPGSATHQFGWAAAELVKKARSDVAALINAEAKEIVFTSGATEANNLAILGVANSFRDKGESCHIITSAIEHKSVLEPCKYLAKNGIRVTFLQPDANGVISVDKVADALCADTVLVSLMHVNNEIGAVNDIAAIGEVLRKRDILFHVDAAQSAGKLAIDLAVLPVDLMSLSAHKIYGPKGIGALFVRDKIKNRIKPIVYGGSQERGLRSGTLATHQIVGMGEAFAIAKEQLQLDSEKLAKLRKHLWDGIKDIEAIKLNSDLDGGAPHILNVSFSCIEGESLIMALKDVAVSTGSACSSATLELSYVLTALGVKNESAHGSLRFSLGRDTTLEEIDYVINLLHKRVEKLRSMSPLWDMYQKGIDLETINWRE